jgi:hypothetical protein
MAAPSFRTFLVCCAVLSLTPSLHAQAPGPTAEQLKSWIAIRQQRVDLLRDEIKQTDARIESRLDTIIQTLTSITDSKDSRTKVARMKEDTMKQLLKTIDYYDRKRAVFREELRNPQTLATEEEKRKVVAAFAARIEKRTQQILALNKSMPAHQDYERYKATGGGWYGTEYQRNEDFEQNQRMTSHSNTQRDAIVKQLDASIDRLDRLGRTLRTQLAATTDPAQNKERAAEIAKNDALIDERRQQKLEILQPANKAQHSIGLKEAMDLDQTIKKTIDELRRDFTTLFARYHTFVSELTALRATEAALADKSAH